MPYAVVSRLPNGIAIGATVIRGTTVDRSIPRPAWLIYGWALTEGVPDDVWEAWLNDNQKAPFVVSQMIYGSKDLYEARRFAMNHPGGSGFSGGAPAGKVSL